MLAIAALHYASPSRNRLKYLLEGYDQDWTETTSGYYMVSYGNLPHGQYVFRVRAANGDGLWSDEEVRLTIRILPPWWRTWWFRLTLLFSVAILAGLIYFRRIHRLERLNRMLEERVERRTISLREAKDQVEFQKNEIIQQKEKLFETEAQKLRFFTTISHEFKTPLTILNGLAEKYTTPGKPTALTRSDAEMMKRNVRQLLSLINQLLDVRRIDRNQFALRVSNTDIRKFVHDITLPFSRFTQSCKLQFTIKAGTANALEQCWFDPTIMEKILTNLLSNAIKYTPDGGKIIFEVKHDCPQTGYLSFVVSDNGRGISQEKLQSVFDRFYQDDQPGFRRFESSGIGLSLAKELTEVHHGTIQVQSQPGKGSSFTVTIPVQQKLYPESTISSGQVFSGAEILLPTEIATTSSLTIDLSAEKSAIDHSKPLILVAEDNTDLRSFLYETLLAHFAVLIAVDGSEALRIATEELPDLILTDIMMPVMDGLELTRRLKQQTATHHIPIIQLTARDSQENIVEGLQTGADDYISKPFNTQALILKIQNILDTRRRLQARYQHAESLLHLPAVGASPDEEFLRKLYLLVSEHLGNESLDGDFMARELAMGKTTLYRKLQALTGQTVNTFIRKIRLQKASEMLRLGMYSISETAYAVGFNNPNYFSRCFFEEYGKTPSDFLQSEK